tara:strand:- start:664 stop:918 length:255 start_codon:yes stop_codon:yes gene_type:complete
MGDFHPEAQVNGCFVLSFIALICNNTSAVFLAISLLKIIVFKFTYKISFRLQLGLNKKIFFRGGDFDIKNDIFTALKLLNTKHV